MPTRDWPMSRSLQAWLAFFLAAHLMPLQVVAAEECSRTSGAAEVEKCLADSQEKQQVSARKATSFPASLSGKTFLKDIQEYKTMTWMSPDGKSLRYYTTLPCTLVCSGGDILVKEIPKERILSYTQGVAGEGSTAGDAIIGTAITAAIVPILAPFQALATTRRTITFAYTLTYLNDEGEEITDNLLATSLVPVWDGFYTFMPTLTGLQYGEKRSLEQLRPVYEKGAEKLLLKVLADQSLLVEQVPKKPWCSRYKASEYPLIYSRYKANRETLNVIRSKLGLSQFPLIESETSEEPWGKYLLENPKLAAWAKANPVAAQKLSVCPK